MEDEILKYKWINVLTFDRFAAKILINSTSDGNWKFWNHTTSIKKATQIIEDKKINDKTISFDINRSNIIDEIKHIIIDEVQDLCNERAQFILVLIKYLIELNKKKAKELGFTFLGDMCQEIFAYLYQDDDEQKICDLSLSASGFFERLKNIIEFDEIKIDINFIHSNPRFKDLIQKNIPEKLQKIQNKLEKDEISDIQEQLYNLFQDNTEILKNQKQFDNFFENTIKIFKNSFPNQRIAILTRKNFDSLRIAEKLFSFGLKPYIYIANRSIYPIWIFRLFFNAFDDMIEINQNGKRDRYLLKEVFFKHWEPFSKIYSLNNEQAWNIFAIIANGTIKNVNVVYLSKFLMHLSFGFDEAKLLEYGYPIEKIIISTIHKAKGREFDKVLLHLNHLKKKVPIAQEAKIVFVGLTRAKRALTLFDDTHMKKKENFYYYFISWYKLSSRVDIGSCFSEKPIDTQKIQEYIGSKINIGDKVKIIIENVDSNYIGKIYHNGFYIGRIHPKLVKFLLDKQGPFEDRIAVLTTEILNSSIKIDIPIYSDLKMFLGFDLLGAIKTNCK
jgi:hypothetical protein